MVSIYRYINRVIFIKGDDMKQYDLTEIAKEINYAINDYGLHLNNLYDFAIENGYKDDDVKYILHKRHVADYQVYIDKSNHRFNLMRMLCGWLDIRWWLYEIEQK